MNPSSGGGTGGRCLNGVQFVRAAGLPGELKFFS